MLFVTPKNVIWNDVFFFFGYNYFTKFLDPGKSTNEGRYFVMATSDRRGLVFVSILTT